MGSPLCGVKNARTLMFAEILKHAKALGVPTVILPEETRRKCLKIRKMSMLAV